MDFFQINVFKFCYDVWETNTEKDAMKILFGYYYKNRIFFYEIFTWLYIYHEETFYKYFSIIIGVPNSQLKLKSVGSGVNYSSSEFNHFICKESQSSFNEYNEEYKKLIGYNKTVSNSVHNLDSLGYYKDIIEIGDRIMKNKKWSIDEYKNKKLYYTIVTLISNEIQKNYKNQLKNKKIIQNINAVINSENVLEGVKQRVDNFMMISKFFLTSPNGSAAAP